MEEFNYDLEVQFQTYLKHMGLSEQIMHPVQATEMRRAFMGACGQMLILLRDGIGDMEEDKGMETLQNMFDQVTYFWETEEN